MTRRTFLAQNFIAGVALAVGLRLKPVKFFEGDIQKATVTSQTVWYRWVREGADAAWQKFTSPDGKIWDCLGERGDPPILFLGDESKEVMWRSSGFPRDYIHDHASDVLPL